MTITTWVLTGLLVACLINSVPTVKASLAGSSGSVLEIELGDDDKDDSKELDLALLVGIDDRSFILPSRYAPDRIPSDAVRTQSKSHLVRGPPCC